MEIIKAQASDIDTIRSLATLTWSDTYQSIVSKQQLDYMFDLMYRPEALLVQMEKSDFYIAQDNHLALGFMSVEPQNHWLHIHKLYVVPQNQGKSIGHHLLQHAVIIAQQKALKELQLHVNRYNTKALSFYFRNGFAILETLDIHIGNGFEMNDYKLSKPVTNSNNS